MAALYIGLMSGTSLDGVDGVLCECGPDTMRVLAHTSLALPAALQTELLALNHAGHDELHRAALAGNALVHVYAQAVQRLLVQSGVPHAQVRAIGAHGQTVRHRPGHFDGIGYTLQLNQPALLAERCAIDVVADFRSRDLAAGGQGAPLVPLFHQQVFGVKGQTRCVLNLGGMANLTVIGPTLGADLLGFDCGPGNVLLDAWCSRHTGAAFDAGGAWAAQGCVDGALLSALLSDAYFTQPAPKSTGRDHFNESWLQAHLRMRPSMNPVDVQATLSELTATACAASVSSYGINSNELIVCGGGAFNADLQRRLQERVAPVRVFPSDALGLPALQVEASAFAWLAYKAVQREALPLGPITGSRGARVLGALYPA